MKIESIESQAYRLPLKEPWGDQTHRITHIELVITEVASDRGLTGTGFTYTVGMGGRSIQSLLDGYIAPHAIGMTVAPRVVWSRLWHAGHDAGGGGLLTMALAAIDIALWDLVAKAEGRPLIDILGQFRESIPAYGSGVNLNLSLPELEEQVRAWLSAGYRAVKIKVGKADPQEDLERVRKVREIVGRNELMIDANQGWDVSKAARMLNAFEPFALYWVEEPLLSDDVLGHAKLRGLSNLPIAIGENVYTKYQFNQYLSCGACDFVQADVVRVGGISPFLEIASLADAWNIPVAPHFMLEIAGQLLCAIPNGLILEDVSGGSFRDLGILAEDVGVENGIFVPPRRIGHGIRFDTAALRGRALVGAES